MSIRFQFDELKATEALAYIAEQWTDVTVFYASKILFFAEKSHINKYYRPIVADTFIAMPNGPVPTTIYDFLRDKFGQSGDPENFKDAIDTSQYPNLKSKRAFEAEYLSASDIQELQVAIKFCKAKTFKQLSDLTHKEESWRKAPTNGSMDYSDFIDQDNPDRELAIEASKEFSAYGVM